jgi:hypothetical protein
MGVVNSITKVTCAKPRAVGEKHWEKGGVNRRASSSDQGKWRRFLFAILCDQIVDLPLLLMRPTSGQEMTWKRRGSRSTLHSTHGIHLLSPSQDRSPGARVARNRGRVRRGVDPAVKASHRQMSGFDAQAVSAAPAALF